MAERFSFKSSADEVLAGVDLRGKRFLITGVSSGIGLETARALIARGAAVTGSVRDANAAPQGDLHVFQMDLSSQRSVGAAADALLADGETFDAVILNAGVMATPQGKTEDGFETQFGINHLGHFAFANRIEPLIADKGRLIVLASQAHRIADVDLDDPNFETQPYDPFVAYGRSKTANILFAVEFDRRHRDRGIRAAAVMPGNSMTALGRHMSEAQLQGLFETVGKSRVEAGLPPAEFKDAGQAAATSVWAATVADADAIGGKYLEDVAVAPINDGVSPFAEGVRSYALEQESAKKLWDLSEAMLSAATARAG